MEEQLSIQSLSGIPFSDFVHLPLKPNTADSHPIRLLHLQPSSGYQSPIRSTLEHVELSPSLRFKALSYAWGDPNITLPIFVDEKPYHVTANCHAALLRLREVREFILWIDAICINQRDDDEKTAQISMMADVYYFASEVIVWLGVSEADRTPDQKENEKLAMQLVDHLFQLESEKKHHSFEYYLEQTDRDNNAKDQWLAFSLLIKHSWFERVWVLQETVVAKTCRALFQFHDMQFQKIQVAAHVAWEYYYRNPAFKSEIQVQLNRGFSGDLMLFQTSRRLRKAYNRDAKQLENLTLDEILKFLRQFKCLDPKDRIFGILALLGKEKVQRINPDYSWSMAGLYSKVTQVIIEEDLCLRSICAAGMKKNIDASHSPLPTWVSDWRIKLQNLDIPSQFVYRLYQASPRTSQAICSFENDSLVLRLAGLCIDTISDKMEINLPRDRGEFPGWSTEALGIDFWRSRFINYPSGGDPYEAWIRTITGDRMDKDGRRTRLNEEYFMGFRNLSVTASSMEGIFEDTASKEMYYQYEHALDRTLWARDYFVSASGYMGLGPKALRQGDMVCIFPGCQIPLLIRKNKDHHLLVGECFAWGIMDGEAWAGKEVHSWKDNKLQELTDEDGLEIFSLR